MILNYTKAVSMHDRLHELPDTFHLTGSRFFGTNGAYSDYDYFVQHTQALEDQLERFGFKAVSLHDYGDALCVRVLRRVCPVMNLKVDVQLVTNARLKDEVQHCFKRAGILSPSREQWNAAITLLPRMSGNSDYYEYVNSLTDTEASTLFGLLQHRVVKMGAKYTEKQPLSEEQIRLVRSGQYISAIKSYRELYNTGLLEAKRAIDSVRYS